MSRLPKAANVAALFLAAATIVLAADAGRATDAPGDSALGAHDIRIDPARIADAAPDMGGAPVDDSAAAVGIASAIDDSEPPAASVATLPVAPQKAASLAFLVDQQDTGRELSAEQYCLAGAVYFEAKGETLAGQLAVAKVVMARAQSGRFPASYCGVVYQPSQFSFVRGGRMPPVNKASRGWKEAVAIARIADADAWESPVEGALFFHARRVSPRWNLARLGAVDNHVFYR